MEPRPSKGIKKSSHFQVVIEGRQPTCPPLKTHLHLSSPLSLSSSHTHSHVHVEYTPVNLPSISSQENPEEIRVSCLIG